MFVIYIRKSEVRFVCKDDDEQTTLDCDAIFEENFLKQSFKKFSSKIARKDDDGDWQRQISGNSKIQTKLSSRLREGVERSGTTVAIQGVLHLVNRHCLVKGSQRRI